MKLDPENSVPSLLIDLERLKDVSDGGFEGLRELAEMYVQTMDENLQKLREAIEKHLYQDAERIAHSAVGASSLIGMIGMVPLLRRIESLCERKMPAELPGAYAELQEMYGRTCMALRAEEIIQGTETV